MYSLGVTYFFCTCRARVQQLILVLCMFAPPCVLAGLDWIANHLMTQERTEGARQQALRLYRNISAADREAVEEGMQELQLILYQFWSDVSMLSTAFDTAQAKWQQERLVQPQQQEQGQQWQLKWAGPLAEGTEENEIQAPPASHHQGAADVQQVYFVTDRTPNKKLAGGFGNTQQSDVTYGVAMVNIPRVRLLAICASRQAPHGCKVLHPSC